MLSFAYEPPKLYDPLTNDEFFKMFSDLIREEFTIHTTQAFLKIIAFEDLLERKFIEFLKDYKIGFEKLQRPLLTDEYSNFIKEKEIPLKLYFQYLKEYLWKLTTQTTVTNYQLNYLLKGYDDCSICDIFAITDDFTLKFNICYILKKMQNTFDQNEINNLKMNSHYQTLYDILVIYSSASELKWIDFSNVDDPFVVKFRPMFLTLAEFNLIECTEVEKETLILNLEKEFAIYSNLCKSNEKFSWSPLAYQEYIRLTLSDRHPDLKITFRLMEEIKLISIFFFFDEFKNQETNKKLKNKWIYFILTTFLCTEILKSSKLNNFLKISFK